MTDKTTLNETLLDPLAGTENIRLATPGANWRTPVTGLFIVQTGPATPANLEPGHYGIFKDSGTGEIVLSVNDGGIIHSVTLVASGLILMEDGVSYYLAEDGTSRFLIE